MHKMYHIASSPLADGERIYEEFLQILGVHRRRGDAIAFCKGRNQHILFELEPHNSYDANAIRIDGCWERWFFRKRKKLGYIPREIAAKLAVAGLATSVRPRLAKTYVGHDGYVEIEYQIVGPASRFNEYRKLSDSPHERIAAQKSGGAYEDAISGLIALVTKTELEDARDKTGVAPGPYHELAVIYRKMKRHNDEIAILERFAKQRHAPGVMPPKLLARLEKAKARRTRA